MDRVQCHSPSEKTHLRKLYLENVERRGHDENSTVSQSSELISSNESTPNSNMSHAPAMGLQQTVVRLA